MLLAAPALDVLENGARVGIAGNYVRPQLTALVERLQLPVFNPPAKPLSPWQPLP